MQTIDDPAYSRNFGIWSHHEQQDILDEPSMAIAGVGGEGFIIGLQLVRMGVQRLDIADPDVFERSNMNRVPGATEATLGKNKAQVFREMALEINSRADVRVFTDGVTQGNVAQFLGRASILLDGSDVNQLHIGVMLAREARARHIPNVLSLNLGFAAMVTTFDPYSRYTFERMMGIPEGMGLEAISKLRPDFSRLLPYIPSYGDHRTLLAVRNDEDAPVPSVSQGVHIAAGLAGTEIFKIIARHQNRRLRPTIAPRVAYIDPYTYEAGVIRHPRVAYYMNLLHMLVRSTLGLNPRASYVERDRGQMTLDHARHSIMAGMPVPLES